MASSIAKIILLFLLLLHLASSQALSTTRLNLNSMMFTASRPFINYFNGIDANSVKVECECHVVTGSGFASGSINSFSAQKMDTAAPLGDMSFEYSNPANWVGVSCSVRLRILDPNDAPLNRTDYTLLYEKDLDKYSPDQPNPFPANVRFPSQTEWFLASNIDQSCTNQAYGGFNCDTTCPTCPTSTSTTSTSPHGPIDDPDCENEELYFWVMIGLACLSGLLLILLIVTISYICCALQSQDQARAAPPPEVRPPPPVYLATPPRDPRYGYRGPPPLPAHRYEETYEADIDSLAGEWNSPRIEARV